MCNCARLQSPIAKEYDAQKRARTKIWSPVRACGWKSTCVAYQFELTGGTKAATHTPRPAIMCVSCNIYITYIMGLWRLSRVSCVKKEANLDCAHVFTACIGLCAKQTFNHLCTLEKWKINEPTIYFSLLWLISVFQVTTWIAFWMTTGAW